MKKLEESKKNADRFKRLSQTKIKKVSNKRTLELECPLKVDFIGFDFESAKMVVLKLSEI